MNLMFWKKAADEDGKDDPRGKPGDRNASRKSSDRESPDRGLSEDAKQKSGDSSTYPKRRLIIGAAIGLAILLAIGLTAWKISQPSPDQNAATAAVPTIIQPTHFPDKPFIKLPPIELPQLIMPSSKDGQTDVEALKKKNEAQQSKVDLLKTKSSTAEIENLKKTNDELKKQVGTLQAELPEIEKDKAEQYQANLDALTKQNNELQMQIGSLKAEVPKIKTPQAEQHQANIDALMKKNIEMQAQIEALKKKQQQYSATLSIPRGGQVAVGSKNPKAAAKTLREAIEAMNAGTAAPPKKSVK